MLRVFVTRLTGRRGTRVLWLAGPKREAHKNGPLMSSLSPGLTRWMLVIAMGCGVTAHSRAATAQKIDRHAVVTRNNPKVTSVDPWAPLSVGNGQFCFTADVTGLQTFADYYHKNGIGLETQARWSWHSNPNPSGYKLEDANKPFTTNGKTLGYPTITSGPAGGWLRENPHAMPLAQLA